MSLRGGRTRRRCIWRAAMREGRWCCAFSLTVIRMSVDQPAEINLMRPGLTAEPLSPEEAEQQQEILKFSAVTALEIGGSSPRRQLTHFNDALVRTLDLPKQGG